MKDLRDLKNFSSERLQPKAFAKPLQFPWGEEATAGCNLAIAHK